MPWWMRPTAEGMAEPRREPIEEEPQGRYKILEEESRKSLEAAVNDWLERGAELVGGTVVDRTAYDVRWIQAILVSNSSEPEEIPKGDSEGL